MEENQNTQESSFDEGFELGEEEQREQGQEVINPANPELAAPKQPEQTEAQPEQQTVQTPQEQPETQIPFEQAGQQAEETQPAQVPAAEPEQEAKKLQDVPEGIRDEFEALKRLNPRAAELALEDNAEGEAIRRRLEAFGAEVAQDRAEATLEKRQLAVTRQKQEEARVAAYNRSHIDYIRQNQPEYYRLMSDPSRRTEAQQYLSSMQEWVASKPYKEAKPLMDVIQRGNAQQICQLVKDFDAERRGKKMPDATGAYAVPSRGAPAAQTGIGDKDDFEAGWDLNR